MPSPYLKEDRSVDHAATAENVSFIVRRGVVRGRGVLLAVGAGGDFPTLTVDERKQVAKTIVESPLIDLVENAPHPVVFGDLLLQYLNQLVMLFNAHLHVGETAAGIIPVTPAPPATPFPPATPSLLSTRVKSG